MKRTFALLLSCLALAAASGQAQPAAESRSVYLLPMGYGFDQFLANHLARAGVFDVVTDAKLAGVVMTDRIGRGFELQMHELYAEPKPAPKEGDKDAEPAAVKAAPVGALSTFGRGRGNIFLVDTRSAQVLWSTYEKPAGSDPVELDRAAERVVARLKKASLKIPKSATAAAPQP